MGVYTIEEGEVFIDGVSVKTSDINYSAVDINVDKIVACYCYNGDNGVESDCKIITDSHIFTVVGYGADIERKSNGLGRHICDAIRDYIDAPIGVTYRKDGKVFEDDEIEVTTYNVN